MHAILTEAVPRPGVTSVDWTRLREAFAWFRDLEECPQDPIFHAEGDVAIHTRLVTEALICDTAWQTLAERERRILFWAALLHDVAKPATTRIEADGRVSSPGHSRRGQIMARRILWQLDQPFAERETLCHLVTHHKIPLYLLERKRPERRLHLASHQTRCDLLVILARADVRGRICQDGGRLLDNIELFAELAREDGCFAGPKAFASDLSRFVYFRKADRAADYAAFDDWAGHVTLLSGLPASGKSTWIAANADAGTVVSLDDIRDELGIAPEDEQGRVVQVARERTRVLLRRGAPIVWNATNLGTERRSALIDLAADYKAKVSIVYCEANASELDRRNRARERPVPTKVLARMLDRWEPPDATECVSLAQVLT